MALAGGAGTIARYVLGEFVSRFSSGSFPWATLVINALGCLVFGFVWSLGEQNAWLSPQQRLIILVGFLGAFTTFSTFAFETALLAKDFQWTFVFGNLLFQNVSGLAFAFLGILMARSVQAF